MNHSFLKLIFLFFFASPWMNGFSKEADTTASHSSRLPVISVSQGRMYFLGDVGYNHLNEPVTSKSGLQFELQKHTNSRLSISLFILGGRVSGQERNESGRLNFESGIVAEGLQLRYDFYSRKKTKQFLTPYISAGIEYMVFHARGDLKDANGNYYHYWDDGTIRNVDQNDTGAGNAQVIYRDYKYETDLRDENIDGFGKYRQATIGFPVGAGVKFLISNRVAMHFGANVHITKTDLIDNVNNESALSRKGNGLKDKIIFTFVSLRYDIAGKREVPRKSRHGFVQDKADFKNVNFELLASEDADRDGIPDINDAVIDTTANAKVDINGKPVDTDNDGIPDYRDKEMNSGKDALVNEEGVTITEEMMEAKWRQDSLNALPAIVEYLHHTDKFGKENSGVSGMVNANSNEVERSMNKLIPVKFRSLDTDGNNQISPAEISVAIDQYLDGKSKFSVTQFYELIDFFFSQN
ncbi:MAG: hypothetical protein NTV09_01000 [Bacteroidetes bacterium]|nr:hypothetical protein [Bacteroidota bacterium]